MKLCVKKGNRHFINSESELYFKNAQIELRLDRNRNIIEFNGLKEVVKKVNPNSDHIIELYENDYMLYKLTTYNTIIIEVKGSKSIEYLLPDAIVPCANGTIALSFGEYHIVVNDRIVKIDDYEVLLDSNLIYVGDKKHKLDYLETTDDTLLVKYDNKSLAITLEDCSDRLRVKKLLIA